MADQPTIEVPLEAFALLMAYCHTGGPLVPEHIRTMPDYPAHHDGRRGHLMKVLEPSVQKAFALLKVPHD